jgi:hypothetical protein
VPQNPRWEYRRLGVPKGHSMEKQQEFDRDLADLGDDGWELVAVEGDAAYFKRQSAEERAVEGDAAYFKRQSAKERK